MPGEPYPVIPAKPSLFNQLDSILKEVSENVNKVGNEAQRIFNDENALYIKETLANLDRISTVIANNNENINHSLKNANVFLTNMAKVSKDFPQLAKDLKVGIEKFNSMATEMGKAGKSVSNTMVAGKTTLDKISQQTIPPAVLLLRRLNAISANLEKVSNEIRQNPSIVIRGSTPPKPGPGE